MSGNLISVSPGPVNFHLLGSWKSHVSEHNPTSRAETGGNIGRLELPYTIIAPRAWDYTTLSFTVRKSFQENQTYLDKVRTWVVKYTPAVKRFRDYSVELSEKSFQSIKGETPVLRVIYMLCLILLWYCFAPPLNSTRSELSSHEKYKVRGRNCFYLPVVQVKYRTQVTVQWFMEIKCAESKMYSSEIW